MKPAKAPELKIFTKEELLKQASIWKAENKKIAFTNGCFDILHPGHIFSLQQAAGAGDVLVVGVNADASVKKLKGESRPVNNQHTRALIIASLMMTDVVCIFEEDTPLELIKSLLPDVLVKGGDYTADQIAGAKEVIAAGGKVIINPIVKGFSTTNIIDRMQGG